MIRATWEKHECPPEIQERLTKAGGVNQFGEPNFRIVWNGSRLGWIGGWWTDRDASGNETGRKFEMREEPKWLPPWDRWILETYRSPDWFGAEWLWNLQTKVAAGEHGEGPWLQAQGPYPSRGDYIFVTHIDIACQKCFEESHEPGLTDQQKAIILGRCGDRKFLELSGRVAETLARMVMRNRERVQQEIRNEIEYMHELEKKLNDARDEEANLKAQEVELTKEQMDRIERVTAPAIERQLARSAKLLHQMSPEQRKAILNRAPKIRTFTPKELIN